MANVFNVLTKFTAKDQTSPTLKTISSGAEKLSLALGVAGIAATKLALDFDKGITKTSTIADISVLSLDSMRKGILDISNDTGKATNDLNEAQYQAISGGIDTANSLQFVSVAAKAAVAGYTDTATSVDGLTTSLNAFGIAQTKAEELADKFLMTQNFGKTTFGELASSIGRVIPNAKSLGVNIDTLLSSYATLTKNGINTSESTTLLKAAFSNISKPTQNAAKEAKRLGISFDAATFKSMGMVNFLQMLQDSTGGNAESMNQLFGSTEAVNAIMTLSSQRGLNQFKEGLELIGNSTGQLQKSFDIINKSDSKKVEIAVNQLKNMGIVIGSVLLPPLASFASFLSENVLPIFQNMNPTLLKVIVGITAIAGVVSTGIVLFGTLASSATSIMTAITLLTPVFANLNLTMSANPIGIIIVAVGALAAGIVYLITETEGLGNAFLAVGKQILKGFLLPINLSFYAVTKLIRAMSNIPKMGFLGGVADSMEQAQNSINQTLTGSSSFVSDGKNLKEAFDGVKWKDSEEQAITSAAATSKHTSQNNAILDINLNDVAGSLESVKMGGSLGDTKVSLNNGWQ